MPVTPTHRTPAERRRRSDCYASALRTIDGLTSVGTLDALADTLSTAFGAYGVDHFIVAGLPDLTVRFEKMVLLKHWSAEWFDVYTSEQYVLDDPVVRMCHATTMPFEWTEAPFDAEREPRAVELMNTAHDFGLKRGFSIPVHDLDGLDACFSVSGTKPEFDDGARSALHLIALYAFERVRRLTLPKVGPNPLTLRERESLTWAAVGKTHGEIAEIMGITERTVTAHMVSAADKLGAANRVNAVVRAMLANYISV